MWYVRQCLSEQFRPVTGKETHALKSKEKKKKQRKKTCHLPVLKIFNYLHIHTAECMHRGFTFRIYHYIG